MQGKTLRVEISNATLDQVILSYKANSTSANYENLLLQIQKVDAPSLSADEKKIYDYLYAFFIVNLQIPDFRVAAKHITSLGADFVRDWTRYKLPGEEGSSFLPELSEKSIYAILAATEAADLPIFVSSDGRNMGLDGCLFAASRTPTTIANLIIKNPAIVGAIFPTANIAAEHVHWHSYFSGETANELSDADKLCFLHILKNNPDFAIHDTVLASLPVSVLFRMIVELDNVSDSLLAKLLAPDVIDRLYAAESVDKDALTQRVIALVSAYPDKHQGRELTVDASVYRHFSITAYAQLLTELDIEKHLTTLKFILPLYIKGELPFSEELLQRLSDLLAKDESLFESFGIPILATLFKYKENIDYRKHKALVFKLFAKINTLYNSQHNFISGSSNEELTLTSNDDARLTIARKYGNSHDESQGDTKRNYLIALLTQLPTLPVQSKYLYARFSLQSRYAMLVKFNALANADIRYQQVCINLLESFSQKEMSSLSEQGAITKEAMFEQLRAVVLRETEPAYYPPLHVGCVHLLVQDETLQEGEWHLAFLRNLNFVEGYDYLSITSSLNFPMSEAMWAILVERYNAAANDDQPPPYQVFQQLASLVQVPIAWRANFIKENLEKYRFNDTRDVCALINAAGVFIVDLLPGDLFKINNDNLSLKEGHDGQIITIDFNSIVAIYIDNIEDPEILFAIAMRIKAANASNEDARFFHLSLLKKCVDMPSPLAEADIQYHAEQLQLEHVLGFQHQKYAPSKKDRWRCKVVLYSGKTPNRATHYNPLIPYAKKGYYQAILALARYHAPTSCPIFRGGKFQTASVKTMQCYLHAMLLMANKGHANSNIAITTDNQTALFFDVDVFSNEVLPVFHEVLQVPIYGKGSTTQSIDELLLNLMYADLQQSAGTAATATPANQKNVSTYDGFEADASSQRELDQQIVTFRKEVKSLLSSTAINTLVALLIQYLTRAKLIDKKSKLFTALEKDTTLSYEQYFLIQVLRFICTLLSENAKFLGRLQSENSAFLASFICQDALANLEAIKVSHPDRIASETTAAASKKAEEDTSEATIAALSTKLSFAMYMSPKTTFNIWQAAAKDFPEIVGPNDASTTASPEKNPAKQSALTVYLDAMISAQALPSAQYLATQSYAALNKAVVTVYKGGSLPLQPQRPKGRVPWGLSSQATPPASSHGRGRRMPGSTTSTRGGIAHRGGGRGGRGSGGGGGG